MSDLQIENDETIPTFFVMVDKINLKKGSHANNSDQQPILSNDYIAPLLNGKSLTINQMTVHLLE